MFFIIIIIIIVFTYFIIIIIISIRYYYYYYYSIVLYSQILLRLYFTSSNRPHTQSLIIMVQIHNEFPFIIEGNNNGSKNIIKKK